MRIKWLINRIQGKKAVCYGAGMAGMHLSDYLRDEGISVSYYAVTKTSMMTLPRIAGIDVKVISEIPNKDEYNWLITVAEKNRRDVISVIGSYGIKDYYIVSQEMIEEIEYICLQKNEELRNVIGDGERCFILGTGGTIKNQDLKRLGDEHVFSCSYCSLLEDYKQIVPMYYVSPAGMKDPFDNPDEKDRFVRNKVRYFEEQIISDKLFFDYDDKPYINAEHSLHKKNIYYISQRTEWIGDNRLFYDLCRPTPWIQTASIMMLKIAMYMGYKTIFLLGTEHDLVTHHYGHAFEYSDLKKIGYEELSELQTKHNNNVESWTNRITLLASYNMYEQYYHIHNAAKEIGVAVYNATDGGSLDEFERVEYESLFGSWRA